MKRIIILLFGFFILLNCYCQQVDTARYLIDGKYYTQQQIDSLQAELIKLEKTLGTKMSILKHNSYKDPFERAGDYLYEAGHLFMAGQFTTLAGIGVTLIGVAAKENYFYIATGGCVIASLVCFIIASMDLKKAGEEIHKISVEDGKIIIKID